MSILNSVLSALGSQAVTIASSIIPGASALPALIKAGGAIAAAFQTVKEANGGTAPAEAQANLDTLLDKVNAHADGTLGRLEDGDT